MGLSTHYAHNTKDFVEHLKDVRLKQGECNISYDVTALFTSVPIQPVVNIIQQKPANDKDLQQRTTMSIKHIISLLEFCLRSTSFVFQGQHYEQLEGAAMGNPLSPIVANIFMKKFEAQVMETAPHPPSLWKRFVDDTFVILEAQYKDEFFHHINSIDENIKFTAETTKADGPMPFLDTLVTPQSDGSQSTTVYRKPTHTNQYLQWDSHHVISNKYSVIISLQHGAKDICSNKDLPEEEQTHIQRVLSFCKYPAWGINRMKLKTSTPRTTKNSNKDIKPISRSYITVFTIKS